MKKIVMFFLVVVLSGCAQTFSEYLEQPQTVLRDPHFAKYQEDQRALEHAYLLNEIDYAQYLERKKDLDDRYTREVQDREEKLSGQ